MTETNDLLQQALKAYRLAEPKGDRGFMEDHEAGIAAVLDLAGDRQAERPEPTDWETLRAAADIYERLLNLPRGNGGQFVDSFRSVANLAEKDHAAARAEAAADAARDALIEKAAKTAAYAIEPNDDEDVSVDDMWANYLASTSRDRYRANARALADAGLLVDPEAEATA